jgi:Ca2+-binding RTX toxin-like protein
MLGGLGNDTSVVDNIGDMVTEMLGEGLDSVQSSITYILSDNVENLTLTSGAEINGTGNILDNIISGNAAANILNGGLGADSMSGGAGNDTYVLDNTGDIVTESLNEGTDLVQSSITYTLTANVENLTLAGTDAINGTGNTLNNIITGNTAANVINGGEGADWLYAGVGDDTLIGGAGNDLLDGGLGADAMNGGLNDDTYVVDSSSSGQSQGDIVTEGLNEGIDLVQSSVTYTLTDNVENLTLTDTLMIDGTGNLLDNIIHGNSGNNILRGMEGNDTLNGCAGADTMLGGVGNDTYVVESTGDVVMEDIGTGIDLVQSSITYTLTDNVENLTLIGGAAINGTGNALDNIIDGNTGVNVLSGLDGNDILNGNVGNDTLDGGLGSDTMAGGAGDDNYLIDNAGDVVIEVLNAGTDTVQSGISYTLGSNLENLVLTGTSNLNATGNTLNNTIIGNSGNNMLDGSAGCDILLGGFGDDTYIVDNYDDVVLEVENSGFDVVQSSVNYVLSMNVENLVLKGTSNISGTGNALDNVISGNTGDNTLSGDAGNDTLDGGAGADTLLGGTGDDTYIVDNIGDAVTESLNAGIDAVQSNLSYTLGMNVENLMLKGTANIDGTGNELDNVIIGNAGTNTLSGGAGNDTMTGGVGNDTLLGGVGNDHYVFNPGDGKDVIIDMQGGDRLYMGGNLTEANLEGVRDGDNMIINVLGTNDSITLTNWFAQTEGVNLVEFSDGSSLDSSGIELLLNRPPVANADSVITTEDTMKTMITAASLLANDTDPNPGDVLMLSGFDGYSSNGNAISQDVTGNLILNIGNRYQSLAVGQTASDSFGYSICDSKGATSFSMVNVVISGTNDAPLVAMPLVDVLVALNGEDEYPTFNFQIPINSFTDVDQGDTLTYRAALANGKLLPDGLSFNSMTQTFSGNVYDLDTKAFNVAVTATDSGGQSATSAFALNIINGDDDTGIDYRMSGNAEKLILAGTAPINVRGNTLNNTITGNNAANILSGGAGADTLIGLAGNDTLNGGSGNDVLEGGSGNDTLTDTSGRALFSGGKGKDTMTGGTSNEIFIGGKGNDTINTGTGSDLIVFNRGDGMDIVKGGIGSANAVSLGGGIRYAELIFENPAIT